MFCSSFCNKDRTWGSRCQLNRCLALYLGEVLSLRSHILQPTIALDTTERIASFFLVVPVDRGTKRQIECDNILMPKYVRPWEAMQPLAMRTIWGYCMWSQDNLYFTNRLRPSTSPWQRVTSSRQRDTPQVGSNSSSQISISRFFPLALDGRRASHLALEDPLSRLSNDMHLRVLRLLSFSLYSTQKHFFSF